ncbi:MAG: M1 family metallopeptidase [Isosphaeraceae bacterium]|nr:M1 family metallopeptidase [Isosphaeraceae bacterium]
MRDVQLRRLTAAFLILLTAERSSLADHYPRQPHVDALHYAFRVILNDETSEILGETTIELRAVGRPIDEVSLDLASIRDGKGMQVDGVESEGRSLVFQHKDDRLRIEFGRSVEPGRRVSLVVRYRGRPAAGLLIGPNKHGDRTYFSENWPDHARQWLPTIDHPSDKATSSMEVEAPSTYQVVSNGLLEAETDLGGGRRRTRWRQDVPIATWLNALGVAPFAVRHASSEQGIPIQTWVFPQDRERLIPALEEPSRRALSLFSEKIGPYPYAKVAGIQAVGFDGGMELAGAIFYGQNSLGSRGVPALVAHEMAHQWFGDSVTESDWNEVWLSEGFATFFAHVYAERYEGRDAYLAGLRRSRPVIFAAERREPDLAVIHEDLADTKRVLNSLVYQKGAWFLHMLRVELGDEAFWAGIRKYYARFRDGNATTNDFRAEMESASGLMLERFFDQWLRRPGSPELECVWEYDAKAKQLHIELEQKQASEPYDLDVTLAIEFSDPEPTRVETITTNERKRKTVMALDREPKGIILDPKTELLFKGAVRKRSEASRTDP